MKQGKYLALPERPTDFDQLWRRAAPLGDTSRPPAICAEEADRYREIDSTRWPSSSPPAEYLAEREQLKKAGIVVVEGTADKPVDRFFVADSSTAWFKEAIWSIGIYAGPDPFHLAPAAGASNPVLTYRDVTDIPASFVADPFLLRFDNRWHMFFEVMNRSSDLGEIGWAVSDDTLNWKYQQIVLAEPFHLSYPYVFEWQGIIYMIPETYQAGAVRLYKADPFPTEWSLVRELIRGPYLVDTSIFQHAGKWWFFVDTSLKAGHDTVRLFSAPDLLGPWDEHPCSPIVESNGYLARPGGRVGRLDNNPVRFTQGCRPYYGTNVRAFEVIELTDTTYREREITDHPILAPAGAGWNACGMHHIDAHFVGDHWLASVDGWRSEALARKGYPMQGPP
jgi:hypothetical protein